MDQLPALTSGDPSAWEQALYAFLVEKGNRSGSKRTVESYSRMLWPFFADLGKTPERVKPADVLAWVHGIGKSGRTPSSTTIGARIACLSSYFRFLIRMGLVVSNPCDAVERPRAIQSVARGYSVDEVRRLLAVVPDTIAGRRDRAILLTLILTGRRRAEVIGLHAGDLSLEGETGRVGRSGEVQPQALRADYRGLRRQVRPGERSRRSRGPGLSEVSRTSEHSPDQPRDDRYRRRSVRALCPGNSQRPAACCRNWSRSVAHPLHPDEPDLQRLDQAPPRTQ